MKITKNRIISRLSAGIFIFSCITTFPFFSQGLFSSKNNSSTNSVVSNYQYERQLNSVFETVQKYYVDVIDPKILYEGALKGMLDALGDPYTTYLDSDYMRELTDTTSGNFGGVGLTITKAVESTPDKPAYVEVVSTIEDSPGSRAGIRSGDCITAIDGESTPEMTMNQVLAKLRGQVGTPVTVSILRGASMRFDVTLVRALIEVPTAKFGMIENTSIGYVRLIEFTPETPHRMQDAINLFESNGYTGMIIDLRDNPGGLITSVVSVADKFIDEGPIVTTKSRLVFENETYSATPYTTTVKKNIPIIVLINHGSASASEILSGALKDYHLAYLIGQRTYGKGSVQQVINLSQTDGYKITMARYYTPSDVNIDKIGIPPDMEVSNFDEMTPEQEEIYMKMINSNIIEKTVENNPNMKESDIAAAARSITATYSVDERIVRRLIRNQVQRLQETPLYDLDYDLQLTAAIDILKTGKWNNLMKNTKTLKELQDSAALTIESEKK